MNVHFAMKTATRHDCIVYYTASLNRFRKAQALHAAFKIDTADLEEPREELARAAVTLVDKLIELGEIDLNAEERIRSMEVDEYIKRLVNDAKVGEEGEVK